MPGHSRAEVDGGPGGAIPERHGQGQAVVPLRSLIYCIKEKFRVKILFRKHYFSLLNTLIRKGKDPDPCL
jgi:hypothetical protein